MSYRNILVLSAAFIGCSGASRSTLPVAGMPYPQFDSMLRSWGYDTVNTGHPHPNQVSHIYWNVHFPLAGMKGYLGARIECDTVTALNFSKDDSLAGRKFFNFSEDRSTLADFDRLDSLIESVRGAADTTKFSKDGVEKWWQGNPMIELEIDTNKHFNFGVTYRSFFIPACNQSGHE